MAGTIMTGLKTGASTLANVIEFARDVRDGVTDNLPEFTKSTNVVSSVYIQKEIAGEDIVAPLLDVLNQIYVSYVLSALNLNSYIAGGRRIKDLLRTVAAEGVNDDVLKLIDDKFYGPKGKASTEAGAVNDLSPTGQRLVSSRLIELTLAGRAQVATDDPGGDVQDEGQSGKTRPPQYNVYLYVQLLGHSVPSEVVGGFVSLNFTAPLWQRIRMLRAGEIKFFRDFILAQDLVGKHQKTLQADSTGKLTEMLERQHRASNKSIGTMLLDFGTERNHNCANTILIADETTFLKACNDVGMDFENFNQRQKFFGQSYTMIVVTVNPMYNTVTMYFNGIAGKGEYNFSHINKSAKGGESVDIKDVMTMLGKGMSPRI